MENYRILFDLMSLELLRKLAGLVWGDTFGPTPEHADREALVDSFDDWIDDQEESYNIPELDDAIVKVLGLEFEKTHNGIDHEFHEVKPRFWLRNEKQHKAYMDIISPQMWWCTLKRDGKNMAQKFTLGAGHKEKRVTRGGETVWEPCHDHMGDDLETAWDITQWINEYSTAFGTPKKRHAHPKKLQFLDSLLADASCVQYETLEGFAANFYGDKLSHAEWLKMQSTYSACQQTLHELRRFLS